MTFVVVVLFAVLMLIICMHAAAGVYLLIMLVKCGHWIWQQTCIWQNSVCFLLLPNESLIAVVNAET